MKIPVYEITDGEAHNGFIKTTTADAIITNSGVVTNLKRVTLRRVTQRYPDMKKPLPVNYKKITKAQAVTALEAAQYGYMMVSITGRETLAHFGLPLNSRWMGA